MGSRPLILVTQSSSPWFFHSFNNSFALDRRPHPLDLPLLSTPRGWQINAFWSGVTDDEWDLVTERILMEGCTGACSPENLWKYH